MDDDFKYVAVCWPVNVGANSRSIILQLKVCDIPNLHFHSRSSQDKLLIRALLGDRIFPVENTNRVIIELDRN
jgi:hypothetical protein